MPPVTKAGGDAFRKEVEFVAKDDAEQRAAGIVMVPDKADLQHDFAREETIRAFADEFGALMDSGSADGGIMHAAWPSEWMSLERNEVLDEAEEIGGKTVPKGAWVQEWQFDDAGTWSLVEDGILGGYSIGAKAVEWDGPYVAGEDDAVDDVAVPDQLPDDAMVWELIDGIIREVSAVDIPAVPDAQILETKADALKRLGDHLGDRNAFIDEAMERGHSENEAERLWDNLNRALEVEGAGDPGKQSFFERVGKAAVSVFFGDDDGDTVRASDLGDVGHIPETADKDSADEQDDEHAAGGETPDDDGSTEAADDMTDDSDTDSGEDKSLAEKNAEQINELTDAVKDLTETISGPQPKTAEIEIGGEVYEVPESAAKAALGVDEDAGVGVAEAIESLKSEVEYQQRRLDAINQQSGVSTQLERNAEGDEEDDSQLEGLGKALS